MGTHTERWKWLSFFSIQIPFLALEAYGKKLLRHCNFHIPRWISVSATLAVLLWMADTFFFPPCLETDLANRVVTAIKDNVSQLTALRA